MRMWSAWSSAWRHSGNALMALALAGCASSQVDPQAHQAAISQLAAEPALCQGYRQAWVSLFKANVEALSDDVPLHASARVPLEEARQALTGAGLEESSCSRPNCMIQPLEGGRLDSYCGYRITATSGEELYQWVPWMGQ